MTQASNTQPETLGQRLTRLRQQQGLTQKDLAERLQVTQSVVSQYEHDMLRLHSELIVQLTEILQVSADELLGIGKPAQPADPFRRRLYRRLQAIEQLPRRDQDALLRTIGAFLQRARVG